MRGPDRHAFYRELIAMRLDRPLSRVELRTLSAHLRGCPECHEVDREYREQRVMLRALPQPTPPRDLWARTSASLDREIARSYRSRKWARRLARAGRGGQPSTSLMTAVAAIGVTAAIAILQLAPATGPVAEHPLRPTPLAVSPQNFAFLGLGLSDVAVYQTAVTQVCPPSEPLDCVQSARLVRTPVGLPTHTGDGTLRAGNISLSPSGRQLAMVGHYSAEDVIAVVTMPDDSGNAGGGLSPDANATDSGQVTDATDKPPSHKPSAPPDTTAAPSIPATPDQTIMPGTTPAEPTAAPTDVPTPDATLDLGVASEPPASVVPGLKVLAILEDVQSAGAPPDWSPNGEMLAFSAMPDDHSTGPDVYVWSPGDEKARAVTSDHASFFASWSGKRIVFSRIDPVSQRPQNVVVDPTTGEQRTVAGPRLWLPSVDPSHRQAVGWFGQMDVTGLLPTPQTGALYVMDWARVDPFRAPTDNQTPSVDATAAADADTGSASSGGGVAATETVTDPADDPAPGTIPASLTPLDPDRDPLGAPILDWQVRWSEDGQVLGVWVADSVGDSWGRLTVLAVDPETGQPLASDPLLSTTLARRGFSLGAGRVAWVGASDANADGELRIRVWGSDGVGGLRLSAPEQEEILPAS